MHGEWRRYYVNGKLKDEGVWVEGTPEGEWSFWSEEGELSQRGRFSKRTKVCTWNQWDASGNKTTEDLSGPNGGTCARFLFVTNNYTAFSMYQFQNASQFIYTGGAGWEPLLRHTSIPVYIKFGISAFPNKGSSSGFFPSVELVSRLGFLLYLIKLI
ncbi:MAG: hypothetical protein KA715_11000 [Xanthomonadaceae bacterium]|nr:hypothetical protein [Xanthomonadaceae bacterium]